MTIEMTNVQRWSLVAATLSFALVGGLPTVQAEDGVARCAAIEEPDARLACFDEETGRAARTAKPPSSAAAVPAPAPAPVPAPQGASPAVSTAPASVEDFGLPSEKRENAPTRITAVVRSVDPHPHVGRWVVTLDNGQVWEQRETTAPAKRPRPGDQVTIEAASFGSYLLVAPGRGSSRVKRVR